MKHPYIPRLMEPLVLEVSKEYPAVLLVGPRQTGKTRMLQRLAEGTDRGYVSLDDLTNRALAKQDPAMFLQLHPAPVLIDEVQYAPELFSQIKMAADARREPGAYWLTGSQPFRLMKLAGETLAGRAAILHMDALSHRESAGEAAAPPFAVSPEDFRARAAAAAPLATPALFREISRGALPGLVSGEFTNRDVFYSSYVQTYIERDVRDLYPGVDPIAFSHLLRAVAARTAQEVNVHEIAKELGCLTVGVVTLLLGAVQAIRVLSDKKRGFKFAVGIVAASVTAHTWTGCLFTAVGAIRPASRILSTISCPTSLGSNARHEYRFWISVVKSILFVISGG